MGRLGQTPKRIDFADRLLKELEETHDSQERKTLLYALLRVLENEPDTKLDPFDYLDKAILEDPESTDLIWEEWRAAEKREPRKKVAALSRILASATDSVDQAHCRLHLARLYNEHLRQPREARQELESAEALSPNLREVIWALAESDAALGKTGAITSRLEKLASQTQDSVFRAALTVEIAELYLRAGKDRVAVSGLLNRALKEEGADWSVVHAVLRLSATIENWELHERALTRMANAASTMPTTPSSTRPAGHVFDGFERGNDVVGALFWYLSVVRESRLGSRKAALEAVTRAIAFLPDNDFLKSERARLLSVLGLSGEALDQLSPDATNVEKAVFLLLAGDLEAASLFGSQERDRSGSLFAEVLAEETMASPPPPESTVNPHAMLSWLETSVGHSAAASTAAALKEAGVTDPLVDVVLEEHLSSDKSLIAILREGRTEPWARALTALLGETENQVAAYVGWANSTADDSLRATLLYLAASSAAKAGDSSLAADLELQAETLALETVTGAHLFEPLQENFEKVAALLADEAADSDELDATRTALFKRAMVLEHALGNLDEASQTIDDLLAISKGDATLLWLAVRLACRKKDWALVADRLGQLLPLVSKDAALLALVAGEIDFFVTKDFERALTCFDRIIDADDEGARETARLYRSLALRLLDREEVLRSALARESLLPPAMADLVPPDVRDANTRKLSSIQAMSHMEGLDENDTRRLLEEMMFGLEGGAPHPRKLFGVSSSLGKLADLSSRGDMADALRAAAALLSGAPVKTDFIENPDDRVSREALWHLVDRLPRAEDPFISAKILKDWLAQEEGLDDWDRVEAILALAEAEDRAGDVENALRTVSKGLESSSGHPGLLETKSELATRSESYIEAADTHGRLAGFYDSQAEKAYHLAQAALILYDKLDNAKGARRVCEEAIRRVPGHAQANDVLDYIYRSCFDESKPQAEPDARMLSIQDTVSDASSDVEVIVEDDQSDIVEGDEIDRISRLRDTAEFRGDDLLVLSYDDILHCLQGTDPGVPRVSPVPYPFLASDVIRDLCEHPRDAFVASEIAELTADIAPPGLEGIYSRPQGSEVIDVDEAQRAAVRSWCRMWGAAAGLGDFEVIVLNDDRLEVAAFQPEDNILFISRAVQHPISARHRFAIASVLWRAVRGLSAFPKGDILGPVRWVISVASAVLGLSHGLPIAVDKAFVDRADIAILDTVRERLEAPCRKVLDETSIALRVWAEATTFSADRFGLLALGRLSDVIGIVVEDIEGETGLRRLALGPRETIQRIPRTKELLAFALSKKYLATRSQEILNDLLEGGGA